MSESLERTVPFKKRGMFISTLNRFRRKLGKIVNKSSTGNFNEYRNVSLSYLLILSKYLKNISSVKYPEDLNKLEDLVILLRSFLEQNKLDTLSVYAIVKEINLNDIKKDKIGFYNTKRNLLFHLLIIKSVIK
jgi:hypothetical protein